MFILKIKLMKKLVVLSVIALLSISCKTSFRITVDKPSVVKLDSVVKKMGVVNAINIKNSPEQKVAGAILGTNQVNGNIEAADRATDGVIQILNRSNIRSGEKISEVKDIYYSDGSVNWNLLDSLAKEKHLDGILTLSKMKSTSPVGGTVLANATGQTSLRLNGSMYVNIYKIKGHVSIGQFMVSDSYNIPTSGRLSILNVLNNARRKVEYFKYLGYQLGHDAGQLIVPHRIWVNRMYYTSGSPVLKRAKSMISKGNWDIAEEQLQLGVSEKDRIRGRVLYNLALVNEGQGDLDKAIEYAKQSALDCGNKEANNYLAILKTRKRIIESAK